MSNRPLGSLWRPIAILMALYAVAYLVGAWLDLATTSLALSRAGASEGNVYANGVHGYDATRAWAINLVACGLIEACLAYSLVSADRVAEVWLERPIRSFAKVYVNPFSRGVADRSALHLLSFVLAFPALRLAAAGNNLLIWRTGTGPLGWLIGGLSQLTSPTLAFWLVMGPAFYLAAFAVSPFAVEILRRVRREPAPPLARALRGDRAPNTTPGRFRAR